MKSGHVESELPCMALVAVRGVKLSQVARKSQQLSVKTESLILLK